MQFRSIYEIPVANIYIYTNIKRINVYHIKKKRENIVNVRYFNDSKCY